MEQHLNSSNMFKFVKSVKQEPLITAMIFVPLSLFLLLIVVPSLDRFFLPNAQFQSYIHYYATAFSGFVAVIIALYSSGVFGQSIRVRMQFITLAFTMLAVLLLMSGLTTPDVLLANEGSEVFRLALNLSLPAGAVFFALAGIRWPTAVEALLERRLWWLWGGAVALLVVCVVGLTAVSPSFAAFSQTVYGRVLGVLIGIGTIALYLWAAVRIRVDLESKYTFSHRLSGTLLLLAEAEFVLKAGRADGLSGFFVYPLLLLALMVAVWAILSTLRGAENLQVSRYFAAAGSVLSVGFSLLLGEFVLNVFGLQEHRLAILFTLLTQGVLGFLLLYVVVVHLDRLVQLRTEDFRREQRLRAEMTQMVIHDLKSPLSVIRSSNGMLLKGYLGPITPKQQKLLMRADESNLRILQLIDNLLDVERLEAGALHLRQRNIESANWLLESLAHWEVVAEAHNKRLLLSVPESLPPLFGDPDLLQRVLNNLMTNALNYASAEGVVAVTAVFADPYVIIDVIDDGPGVPDSDKLRIFEKFAQVEGASRRGSGLGLTFCRMVVEAHSGTLVVDDNPGGGAVFRLTLPINPYRAEPATQEADTLDSGGWTAVPLTANMPLAADDR